MKIHISYDLDTEEDKEFISWLLNIEEMFDAMWKVQDDLRIHLFPDPELEDYKEEETEEDILSYNREWYDRLRIPGIKWDDD